MEDENENDLANPEDGESDEDQRASKKSKGKEKINEQDPVDQAIFADEEVEQLPQVHLRRSARIRIIQEEEKDDQSDSDSSDSDKRNAESEEDEAESVDETAHVQDHNLPAQNDVVGEIPVAAKPNIAWIPASDIELPEDSNEKIFEGSLLTILESFLLILQLFLRFHFSKTEMDAICQTIAIHCPDGTRCPASEAELRNFFWGMESGT